MASYIQILIQSLELFNSKFLITVKGQEIEGNFKNIRLTIFIIQANTKYLFVIIDLAENTTKNF
jgi:hypothetical protein